MLKKKKEKFTKEKTILIRGRDDDIQAKIRI